MAKTDQCPRRAVAEKAEGGGEDDIEEENVDNA
jgi:hypothetical protein